MSLRLPTAPLANLGGTRVHLTHSTLEQERKERNGGSSKSGPSNTGFATWGLSESQHHIPILKGIRICSPHLRAGAQCLSAPPGPALLSRA